ncbi:MAG: glutamine-hydrolyzing carbamoyl-phosphate synthase small subunit [Patescibacteria group bacterium]|nr:glutamine-hydrolyzing carbamoyl-phosphate synthase small subunit [Patescibacteria group bacterium]
MAKSGQLVFADGTTIEGRSFGADRSSPGEIVFSTGMVGYPESFTDPSYSGQILVMTYPLVGNYGIPEAKYWESEKIQIAGLVVSSYIDTPNHFQSTKTLATWLKEYRVPALEIKDTRFLAKKIRDEGVQLGRIIIDGVDPGIVDVNAENLAAQASLEGVRIINEKGTKTVAVFDCGVKNNIIKNLVDRNIRVVRVPWDYDIFTLDEKYDGVLLSNGPGDPKTAVKTIEIARQAMERDIPIFGICLGNQILALAAGGDTYKLKFGHRSQNQPCIQEGTGRCYLTTQNHGFAVGEIPKDFKPWFTNANDGTNEGIHHVSKPFFSVQFHPEATPGPSDTEWLFDYFVEKL